MTQFRIIIPARYILVIFLLAITSHEARPQHVYERGTFVSLPAGKHVNHSYYGTWNVYFATEDGVLVYDHHKEEWLDPITASDGLLQYPALLVWQDQATQDVWIITPDYAFVYDQLTGWMSSQPLPREAEFTGLYSLGVTQDKVVVTSQGEDVEESYSAIFHKASGAFHSWGEDSTLDIDWADVQSLKTIPPEFEEYQLSLPVKNLIDGTIDASGKIYLEGFPAKTASDISALSGLTQSGDIFISTYGMGVFHQRLRGGDIVSLPFGLLSPDVMCMDADGDSLLIGGRAGITILNDYLPEYEESLRDPVFDYSFVSAIDKKNSSIFIAGRGGVFSKAEDEHGWKRLVSTKDLTEARIYDLAAGDDGLLMIGTQRNAYLYHESGLLMHTLFSEGLDWPVFNITFSEGNFYVSTYYGLYVFDAAAKKFTARISSYGKVESPHTVAVADPIYEIDIQDKQLWASSHRGLIQIDMVQQKGSAYLAPNAPFKPRGLCVVGGRAWVGTESGLHSFNPKKSQWRYYSRNDGLISDFVTDLVADDNYIWLGSNMGLTRIKWRNLY